MQLISHLKTNVMLAILLASVPLQAAEFYVAPNGNDGNSGTLAQPFASVTRGQQAASAGDTVWIRGGDYVFSGTNIAIGVLLDKNGAEGKRINYWAYQDEKPVFDFFKLATWARIKGFSVTGNWLHLRGLEIRGVQQIITNVHESWAIRVEGGSNNIFERLNLHHNEGPGLFIAGGSRNLVLNCDSHHNWDPDQGGQNADGFGCHSTGDGNVFRGCRAWCNADDGYDFINCLAPATVEYSWSWSNGFVPDTTQRAGNGAGFKAGGFGLNSARFPEKPPRHVIRFNLSFNNRVQGFYANYHPGPIEFYNNTAFNNPRNFDMQTIVNPVVHILRNNLAYGTGQMLANVTQSKPDDQFNSWNLPITVTNADFLSVSPEGMDAPRQPDGSLPRLNFMRLAPGSKLIDAGKDVGLPFKGTAPDLGAFETEPPRAVSQLSGSDSVGRSGSPSPVPETALARPLPQWGEAGSESSAARLAPPGERPAPMPPSSGVLATGEGASATASVRLNQPGEFDQSRGNAPTSTVRGARAGRGPVVQAHSPRDDKGQWTPTDYTKVDPKLPTLVIAGDSTAAPGDPNHRGWGAVLVDYFDTGKINVVNRSRGGRSFRTFVEEKLWDQILANLKPSDIVMIQLGQNDGGSITDPKRRADLPGMGNEMQEVPRTNGTIETVYTYGWYTRKFIRDAKEKGAMPVVMSMTAHNSWTDAKVRRNLGKMYDIAKQIAGEEKVLFLDHTNLIADEYDKLGAEAVKAFFPADFVHTSTDGAVLNAEMFIAGVKGLDIKPLVEALNEKGKAIGAAKPAAAE